MPKAQIQALRSLSAGTDAQVVEFRGDMDRVLAGARAVVGMAGYNTVAETLRARRPALLVPRARPSQEQLVRARAVSQQPSYEMLHPDDLDPKTMREALGRLLEAPQPDAPPDEYEGADSSAHLLSGLADAPRARRHVPHRAARAQSPSREHG
jgi:predicted glycosyltransferase